MDQHTLNIFLLLFLIIIAVCTILVSYYSIRALKTFMLLADEWTDTAKSLREKIQLKFLAAIPSFLMGLIKTLRKRG